MLLCERWTDISWTALQTVTVYPPHCCLSPFIVDLLYFLVTNDLIVTSRRNRTPSWIRLIGGLQQERPQRDEPLCSSITENASPLTPSSTLWKVRSHSDRARQHHGYSKTLWSHHKRPPSSSVFSSPLLSPFLPPAAPPLSSSLFVKDRVVLTSAINDRDTLTSSATRTTLTVQHYLTHVAKKKKKKSAHRQRACRSLNTQCVREVSFRRSKERVYRGLSPFCVIHDWSTRSISPQWAQRFIRLLDSLIFGKRRREERGRGGILGRPLRFMLVEDQTALCSPAGWIAVMSGDCLSLFPTDWKKNFSSSYCDFFFFQQTKHP